MVPAVLARRRSPALQQHRTRTRTRSLPTAARPLRIIMWPYGSHICLLPTAVLRATIFARRRRSARLGSPLLTSAFGSRPCYSARARARADVTWPRACARARHATGPSRTSRVSDNTNTSLISFFSLPGPIRNILLFQSRYFVIFLSSIS